MFDTVEQTADPDTCHHQRARGTARVALSQRGAKTCVRHLRQSGSAKAFLPRTHGDACEVVFLNTAGGLTGGDRFKTFLSAGENTFVSATTQTAERAYASSSGVAHVECEVSAEAGSTLNWMPQETILFDRAGLHRNTIVNLHRSARFLMAETIVLGRTAMGESVWNTSLRDRREIRRDGRVVLLDPLRLDAGQLSRRANPSMLDNTVAISAIYLISQDAESYAPRLRHKLQRHSGAAVSAGVSAWNEKLVVRLMSGDAYELRQVVMSCLRDLTGGALPRVWQI